MTDPGLLWSAPGAAFTALTTAVLTLWLPGPFRAWWAPYLWAFPCATALAAAYAGGVIDARAGVVLIAFGGACVVAAHATTRAVASAAHVVMLGLCAALFLHTVPGFENPALVTGVVLGPGSAPYSKALNFDKGLAGLLLLGLYLPRRSSSLGAHDLMTASWRLVLALAVVLALALALGYVRWETARPA